MLAYPVAVYFGLSGRGPRFAALLLLALILPTVAFRLARLRGSRLQTLAFIPLITATLLVIGAILDRAGFVLVVPTAVNAVLLVAFGSTLVAGPPMIERFARLQHPDLSPDEAAWCRTWTLLWCAFFVANGAVAAVLAAQDDLGLWAAYNGGVAYVLMGLMFAVEWVVRKLRFGRLGSSPVDRVFARLRGVREEER